MDHKKNPHRRSKRQNKIAEDNYWDCSVCTYRNTAEAFKCLMCDVRKGTSTRKPRINPQLVAQQVAQQYNQSLPKVKKESAPGGIASSSSTPTPTTTPTPPVTTSSGSILPSNPPPPPPSSVAAAPAVVTVAAAATTAIVTATTTTTVTTTAVTNTTATNTLTAASSKVDSGIAAGNKSEKRYSPSVDSKSSSSTRRLRPKLKNVDRSSAEHKAVTVNNVTVIITEFQPKRHYSSSSDHGGHHPSSGSTAPGSNHSSGGRGGGASVGGGAGGGMGTFQMEASPAENGLHPELSHKHQRLAL